MRTETLLFFDDQSLARMENAVRVWHSPELVAVSRMESGHNIAGCAYPTVSRDRQTGNYRVWYQGCSIPRKDGKFDIPLRTWHVCYGESVDGWSFHPVRTNANPVGWLRERPEIEIPAGIVFTDNAVTPLQGDVRELPDDSGLPGKFCLPYTRRRFKEEFDMAKERFVCSFAFSDDGFDWRIDESLTFMPERPGMCSDTMHVPLFNHGTGKWQMVVRPKACDRRIALIESEDFKHWSEPRLVLEPDADDPDALQFYGMPTALYENLWLGFLWEMRTDPERRGCAQGDMDVHLTFSRDGLTWRRAKRLPDGPAAAFIPLRAEGQFGHRGIECGSMLVDDDGDLRLYANGFLVDHSVLWNAYAEGTTPMNLLAYKLRRDGFVSLRAEKKEAMVETTPFTSTDGEFTINARIDGELRAALKAGDKILPGHGFDDFEPWTGDDRSLPLRWRGKNVLPAGEKRLVLRYADGDVYAVRFGMGLLDLRRRDELRNKLKINKM